MVFPGYMPEGAVPVNNYVITSWNIKVGHAEKNGYKGID